MFADLTWEMCTPKERWMPEQSRQTKTPKFLLVHLGFSVPQSKQCLFSFFAMSLLNSSSRSAWCAMAARAIPDKHAPCPGLCYGPRSAPIPDKSTCGRPRPLARQISHPLERNRRSMTQETRVYSPQIKNPVSIQTSDLQTISYSQCLSPGSKHGRTSARAPSRSDSFAPRIFPRSSPADP